MNFSLLITLMMHFNELENLLLTNFEFFLFVLYVEQDFFMRVLAVVKCVCVSVNCAAKLS